jgi:hypothetical protein
MGKIDWDNINDRTLILANRRYKVLRNNSNGFSKETSLRLTLKDFPLVDKKI